MNLPLAIVYGMLAVVLVVLYLKFFYVDDLSDLYLDLRGSGWGYLGALAIVAGALVVLVLIYEVW